MANGSPAELPLPRRLWVVALRTQPTETLLALADELATRHGAEHRSVPKAGLAMLRLRDAALREPFNLGEIPLSVAEVRLRTPHGEVIGAAQAMVDDVRLAAALAVLDGVLAHRLEGWKKAAELLELGAAVLAERDRLRRGMLEKSRVSFSLLSQEGEAEDA